MVKKVNKNLFKYDASDVIIFVPPLLYPPLVFSDIIPPFIRVGMFIGLLIYLSYRLFDEKKRFLDYWVVVFCGVLIHMVSVAVYDFFTLRSVGNYLLTILYGLLLSRFMVNSPKRLAAATAVYIKFFSAVCVLCVLSQLFHYAFGVSSIYGDIQNNYGYLITPFGILLPKTFFSVELYRSFFFFIEPSYFGGILALNIGLLSRYNGHGGRSFVLLNWIAGVFSFSVTFYAVLLCCYILRNLKRPIQQFSLVFIIILIFGFGYNWYSSIFEATSADERVDSFGRFLDMFNRSTAIEVVFGNGLIDVNESQGGLSSGILNVVYEFGFFGLLLQSIVLWCMRFDFVSLILFYVLALAMDPIKFPSVLLVFVLVNNMKRVSLTGVIPAH
jgi:hypothetical protein